MFRLVVTALVLLVLGTWVTWTLGRLERLALRVETAWSALDATLVRRAAAATELAAHLRRHGLVDDALARSMERAALVAGQESGPEREGLENDLSRALRAVLAELGTPPPESKTAALVDALQEVSNRVGMARQFFNDAVRDNTRLRRRWMPRLLTLRERRARRRAYFEIDDVAIGAVTEPVG